VAVVELPISQLAGKPVETSSAHLDPARVSYYVEHFDEAAPVVVYDVGGHLLLADGHHRLAAAQQLGRRTIRADVRSGERRDALSFAVARAQEQRGLTQDEALAAILRRCRDSEK
jgi:uncharacterized protein (DUF1015 family)